MSCEEKGMNMLLEGYRVLDWTIWQQGLVVSVMLRTRGLSCLR